MRQCPPPSTSAVRAVMRANRRTDTKPELRIRSLLHARGYRFRKDCRLAMVKGYVSADIVFPRYHVAVFIDGCFWHSCPDHGTVPSTNRSYWQPKLARNLARDEEVNSGLGAAGWTVIRVWEHVRPDEAASIIIATLGRGGVVQSISGHRP
jgi:DNA mismatch endonuclease, patch repair protein